MKDTLAILKVSVKCYKTKKDLTHHQNPTQKYFITMSNTSQQLE